MEVAYARIVSISIDSLRVDEPPARPAASVSDGDDAGVLAIWTARAKPVRHALPRSSPGLFGSVPPPAGPAIERYASAEPWPRDRVPGPAPPRS